MTTPKLSDPPMTKDQALTHLSGLLTAAARCIVELEVPAVVTADATADNMPRDAGESTKTKDAAKKELMRIGKALQKFGEDYSSNLQYFLGSKISMLSDAFELIRKTVVDLR